LFHRASGLPESLHSWLRPHLRALHRLLVKASNLGRQQALIIRPKNIADSAIPSGNAVADAVLAASRYWLTESRSTIPPPHTCVRTMSASSR
jgi:hypothetical protein